MKKYFFKKNISVSILLLIVIIAGGIFLRTYDHYNLLRFNPDQARDASMVGKVITQKEAWPLLGPKAGGTGFKLGPIFYYFEIIFAKIFGNLPNKMSFPDLMASILSIPLLYLFLKKYFKTNTSLWVTSLFTVSFYTVKYARFAWNPNSLPFWTLLFFYALLKVAEIKEKRKFIWSLIAGVALGVAVQLHSLILFTFPLVLLFWWGYLYFRKNSTWRWIGLVIFMGLIINTPQIYSEMKTGGKNTQAFFQGMEKKSSRKGSLKEKLILDTVCHIQSTAFMLTSLGNDNKCDLIKVAKNNKIELPKKAMPLMSLILALIFSLGAYGGLIYFWYQEKGVAKKNFLTLVLLYSGILFLILIPLADEISFRFFLAIEFLPFILLGVWIKYLKLFNEKKVWLASLIIISILISINLRTLYKQYNYLKGKGETSLNGFEEITLGETSFMADFIEAQTTSKGKVYLKGKASELFKIIKPINFFTHKKGIKVNKYRKTTILKQGDKVFLVRIRTNTTSAQANEAKLKNYTVVNSGNFARAWIYQIKE